MRARVITTEVQCNTQRFEFSPRYPAHHWECVGITRIPCYFLFVFIFHFYHHRVITITLIISLAEQLNYGVININPANVHGACNDLCDYYYAHNQ